MAVYQWHMSVNVYVEESLDIIGPNVNSSVKKNNSGNGKVQTTDPNHFPMNSLKLTT